MMRKRRYYAAIGAAIALVGTSFGSPVSAELSSEAAPGTAGVVNRIPGATDFQRYLIRDIEVGAGHTYLGGFFLDLTDSTGQVVANQSFVGAFSADGTAVSTGFLPNVNGPVNEVELSPDGSRLFIGGEFTEVDGQAVSGVAALDPNTGRLQDDWAANATWRYDNGKFAVDALEAGDRWLYVGGNFTDVQDTSGTDYAMQRLFRIDMTSGLIDPDWTPTAQGQKVASLELAADRSRVYVGGAFTSINNDDAAFRFGVIDTVSGDLVPGLPQGTRVHDQLWTTDIALGGITNRPEHYPFDILEFGNYVAWTGDRTVAVLDKATLREVWSFNRIDGCELDGDPQVMEYLNGYLYVGGHFEEMDDVNGDPCGLNPGGMFRWDPATGEPDADFDINFDGFAPSVWGIRASGDSLYIGGVFDGIGGVAASSFARLDTVSDPNKPVDSVAPSAPGLLTLSSATSDSLGLSWAPSTDNVGVDAYLVSSPDFDDVVVDGATTEVSLTGLTPSTGYSVTVVARDAAGNVSAASRGVFSTDAGTPGPSTTVPVTPTTVPVTPTTADPTTPTTGPTTPSTTIPGPTTSTTTPTTTTPVPSTTTTTAPADNVAPSVPAGLATSAESYVVNLTWTGSSDNVGVESYLVMRAQAGSDYHLLATVPGDKLGYDDYSVFRGSGYDYYLVAVDAAGNRSWRSGAVGALTLNSDKPIDPSTGEADVTRPEPPFGLWIESVNDDGSSVSMTWDGAFDYHGTIVSFEIYRSDVIDVLGDKVGETTELEFTDTDVPAGQWYYSLKANDDSGNRSWRSGQKTSVAWDDVTGRPDVTRPSIPTGLSVKIVNGEAHLTWNESTDDTGVMRYVVYRATANGELGESVGQIVDTEFVDEDFDYERTHWYYIKAEDAAGNASWRTGSVTN